MVSWTANFPVMHANILSRGLLFWQICSGRSLPSSEFRQARAIRPGSGILTYTATDWVQTGQSVRNVLLCLLFYGSLCRPFLSRRYLIIGSATSGTTSRIMCGIRVSITRGMSSGICSAM